MMKHYVIEFANDIINTNRDNPLMLDSVRNAIEDYTNHVLDTYNRGLITSREAVYLMSKDYDFLKEN